MHRWCRIYIVDVRSNGNTYLLSVLYFYTCARLSSNADRWWSSKAPMIFPGWLDTTETWENYTFLCLRETIQFACVFKAWPIARASELRKMWVFVGVSERAARSAGEYKSGHPACSFAARAQMYIHFPRFFPSIAIRFCSPTYYRHTGSRR